MSLLVAEMLLTAVLSANGIPRMPQIAVSPTPPSLSDVVAGADVCVTRELPETKMLTRISSLGWRKTGELATPKVGNLTTHARNNVSLTYFHGRQMKQCVIRATPAARFDVEELVGRLAAFVGRRPKVERRGVRYLFFLPRSDILTLNILTEFGRRSVELSVVH